MTASRRPLPPAARRPLPPAGKGVRHAGVVLGCALLTALAVATASSAPAQAATAPTVEGESVSNVSGTGATLQAQIDPGGSETTYHFEYGTVAGPYTASAPVPDASAGAGESGQEVSVHIQGLLPGVAYHYRVVAVNELQTVDGPDQTLTTQPAGGEFVLPDGRQYELVSPPNKDGAEVTLYGLASEEDSAAAAADGSKVAYLATGPFANPTANANDVQIFSSRGPEGWSSREISPAHSAPTGAEIDEGPEFHDFSADLSQAVVIPFGATTLSPLASEGLTMPYLLDTASGDFQPVLTAVPEGFEELGDSEPAPENFHRFHMYFEDATADLSHIVFRSRFRLTPNSVVSPSAFASNIYEWSDGRLQLVNVGPEGKAIPNATFLGMSGDGSRILWTDEENPNLYLRNTVTDETTVIELANKPREAAISADGSKVFFTYPSHGNGLLYSASVSGGAQEPTLISNGPLWSILGMSTNGSYVYYEEGESQEFKIYAAHDDGGQWTSTLIKGGGANFKTVLAEGHAVAATGRYLAFTSKQDGEVYLYDASSNRLVCISCNPTGAQTPSGAGLDDLTTDGRVFFQTSEGLLAHDTNGLPDVYEWEPTGVGSCASTPGCLYLISSGTGDGEATFLAASADGNDVFFRARDRLTSQDIDNNYDAYDAHVCTAAAPCSPPSVSPPPCTSSDACKAPPTPQPTIFGAPPSATFIGAANVAQPPAAAPAKAKKKPKKRRRAQARKGRRAQARKGRRAQPRKGRRAQPQKHKHKQPVSGKTTRHSTSQGGAGR